MAGYWVYVLTNKPRGTLYVGVTNDLARRAHEHREGLVGGFAKQYQLKMLVHFERYDAPAGNSAREEHQAWPRLWKLRLVETTNPQWRDLIAASPAEGTSLSHCHCRA